MPWSPVKIERLHKVQLSRFDVWTLLSETDHLNRVIRLFPVNFGAIRKDASGPFREASAKVGNLIPLKWREYPFQWVIHREHIVERLYDSGPLQRFVAGIELFDEEPDTDAAPDSLHAATRIRFYAEVTPRNLLGFIAIHLVGARSIKNTIQYLDNHFRSLPNESTLRRPQLHTKYKVNTETLDRLLNSLTEFPIRSEQIPIIRDLLHHHDDDEVVAVRPYELASYYKVDPLEMLKLFLYATKIGIFNLSWNMMCPNCRVSKVQTSSLSGVTNSFHLANKSAFKM